MQRIHLIINPQAGHRAGGRFGAGIAQYLRRAGCQVTVQFTRSPRDAVELARNACQANNLDCLAVAGGDGTLFEVVNGVLQAGSHGVPIGLIPIGTGNDFAKMLDLKPRHWQSACDVIMQDRRRCVDAGQINEHYFINGVGIGFDAQVALKAAQLKWLPGMGAYVVALITTLVHRYHTPVIRLQYDNHSEITQPMTLITVGNGRCHGGMFRLTPNAVIDDGLFDVLITEGVSRSRIIKMAPRVIRGTHLGQPGVTLIRSQHVSISSDEPLVIHADGEILYTTAQQLNLTVLPKALTLLTPAA